MATDYSSDIQDVLDSITDAGELCTWRRFGIAEPVLNVPMLFYPETRLQYAYLLQRPSEPVPVGTQAAIMPNLGWEPSIKDLVTRTSGQVLKLNVLNEVNPNGQVILYILSLSR